MQTSLSLSTLQTYAYSLLAMFLAVMSAGADAGEKLAKVGAKIKYTLYVVNGATAISDDEAAVVITGGDTRFSNPSPAIACTPRLATLAANTVSTCDLEITIAAADIKAAQLPTLTATVVTGDPASPYTTDYTLPAVKLYQLPTITAGPPAVVTTTSGKYVDGGLVPVCDIFHMHLPRLSPAGSTACLFFSVKLVVLLYICSVFLSVCKTSSNMCILVAFDSIRITFSTSI